MEKLQNINLSSEICEKYVVKVRFQNLADFEYKCYRNTLS